MKKLLALILTLALCACAVPSFAQEALEGDTFSTASVGQYGAVASSCELANRIGIEILQAGGNAIDAAVAMIYAVGLAEPSASGLGGMGEMLIYLADEDRYLVIEYNEQAPAAAVAGKLSTAFAYPTSAESISIPGSVHGTLTALEKYGTMSREEVLAPVIKAAREGFPMPERWNVTAETMLMFLSLYEYTLNLYTDNGLLYEEGTVITNPDLADTLQLIADEGIEGFYNSDFTDMMVEYLKSVGGVLTREDFAQYTSVEREAISTTYRGHGVYTVDSPSNGGVPLLEMLNIMENFDLPGYGFGSPETLQIMNDAFSIAYMDGVSWIADSDYYNLPVAELIGKEYAADRAAEITLNSALLNALPGDFTVTLTETGEEMSKANDLEQGGTTHIAVMDSLGNVVSTTNTTGMYYGTAISVPGTGFPFNAHLANLDNSPEATINRIMPYIRVRSCICPAIVTDTEGKPMLAVGSPGNWALVTAVQFAISDVVDFGMNVAEAVNAPRTYRNTNTAQITIEDRFSEETQAALTAMGYELTLNGDYGASVGCLAAVMKDKDGTFSSCGDNRRTYSSLAY